MSKEKFGPYLSEVGLVCEPWLNARFLKKFYKLFLGYLRKMAISVTMAYLLSVIILLHVYNRKYPY